MVIPVTRVDDLEAACEYPLAAERRAMSRVNEHWEHLVQEAKRYFSAESDIAWTYFQSSTRTPHTDRRWLRRQCFKELWGSGVGHPEHGLFLGPVLYLRDVFDQIDRGVDRHVVLSRIEDLHTEFAHYCAFADIHDALPGPKLDPHSLQAWPADEELARLRYACRERHGRLGDLAVRFTEGGGGALYRAGMRLAGAGELDDRIARACEGAHRDEVGHMRAGSTALAARNLSPAQWNEIGRLIREILLQRLHMRNEQFDRPVSDEWIHTVAIGQPTPGSWPKIV